MTVIGRYRKYDTDRQIANRPVSHLVTRSSSGGELASINADEIMLRRSPLSRPQATASEPHGAGPELTHLFLDAGEMAIIS